MLKKRLDGLWIDRMGFVAAVMLKWNSEEKDGTKHYRFLMSPYHTEPYDIVANGEDDSVLISNEMFTTLVARKVARAMTDEEAEQAKANDALTEASEVNKKSAADVTAANAKSAAENSPTNPSKEASPVPKPVKLADKPELTQSQLAISSAAKAATKKG